MKTAVLIPSHIYYHDQLDRLEKCLESVCSQTKVPDIFVSISFADNKYKLQFTPILRKYPTVKFAFSPKQKFQMEHLLYLSSLVIDYDMLMFCDDDDLYHPMRVEKFIEAFKEAKDQCKKFGNQFGGVKEVKDAKMVDDPPEYWAYGIPPSLLNKFFNRIHGYEDLLCHKFADMYLREYLFRTGIGSIAFGIILPSSPGSIMYQYTMNNPNSICERHKALVRSRQQTPDTVNSLIRDNVTLGLICNRYDLVFKQMTAASAPFSRLNDIVPNAERIKNLTNTLYKKF